MQVLKKGRFKEWDRLLRIVRDILPPDDFVLHEIKKLPDGTFKAFAEDDEYYYEVWFSIDEGEEGFRLLDFLWEEKHGQKGF